MQWCLKLFVAGYCYITCNKLLRLHYFTSQHTNITVESYMILLVLLSMYVCDYCFRWQVLREITSDLGSLYIDYIFMSGVPPEVKDRCFFHFTCATDTENVRKI